METATMTREEARAMTEFCYDVGIGVLHIWPDLYARVYAAGATGEQLGRIINGLPRGPLHHATYPGIEFAIESGVFPPEWGVNAGDRQVIAAISWELHAAANSGQFSSFGRKNTGWMQARSALERKWPMPDALSTWLGE